MTKEAGENTELEGERSASIGEPDKTKRLVQEQEGLQEGEVPKKVVRLVSPLEAA